MTKLIVGSPEAMQREPSLEPPEERCDTSVEIGDYAAVIRRSKYAPKASLTEPSEDDVFPKGIDDSMGG